MKRPRLTQKKQLGLSLIELMVAMVLGLVLLGGVIQVLVGNVQTFKTNVGVGRIQESARFVISELAQNLRSVGYSGCMSKELPLINNAAAIYGFGPAGADILSFKVPSNGTFTVGTTTITDAIQDTHAITVKSLTSQVKLKSNDVSNAIVVHNSAAFAKDDILFIGDCERNDIVAISSVNHNTNTIKVANSLSKPYGSSAFVHKVEVTTYFIAPSQTGIAGNSIFRQVNEGTPQELALGIEDMQFQFAVDTDNDNIANRLYPAGDAGITDSKAIIAVRMLLNTTSIDSVNANGTINRDFTISINLRNRLTTGV